MSLLRDDLQTIVGATFADLFLDGTLNRKTTAYDGNGDLTNSAQQYAVKCVEDTYSDIARAQGIPSDQRKFIILASGLGINPNTDDTFTFESETLSIVGVSGDPARATWTIETR